jgi:hypothetical protein
MSDNPWTVNLLEIYCPYCHLATRADHKQCLHCHKRLSTDGRKDDEQPYTRRERRSGLASQP